MASGSSWHHGCRCWCPWRKPSASPFLAQANLPANSENARLSYAYPENQALVAFVDAAAGEIIKKGEAVFPEFRQKNGRWFRGERYVFVMDLEGNRYVYPPDPANERVNLLADRDLGGKPIGKLLVDRARQGDGRGWVHYQWNRPQPEHRRPVWKSTYVVRVQAPSGKTYLVGSGIYEGPMEKSFVVDEVNAAVRLLQVQGRAGFDQLRDPASRFVFRDTYVFVNSPDGVELVNAGFPELEGRNLMGLEDAEGQPMVRNYIQLALERDSGWISYLWPQPDRSLLPIRKSTYVSKVVLPDGEILVVGAGLYTP
jgi:signal transduction histidine kinase